MKEEIEVVKDEDGIPCRVVIHRKGNSEEMRAADGSKILIIAFLTEILKELKKITKSI